MSVDDARIYLDTINFTKTEARIVQKVMKNVCERLEFLAGV